MKDNYCYPKNVRAAYDNGGKTYDRYTIVYNEPPRIKDGARFYECFGASDHPTHPQGFGQHSECMLGRHLGRKVPWLEIPEEVRRVIENEAEQEGL
jgi:hypothetical protein